MKPRFWPPSPTTLADAASAALTSLTARPGSQWDIEGPALCHGYAGVLQSTGAVQAAEAVTSLFDPQHRFGFRHVADQAAKDEPGFLVGAALALADHGQLPAGEVPARWDALLLLS
ncbi:MAG TPA: hypothetical protein VMV92_16815 [Streptosporangiaceae bacterium]|nr:hypothetical protein [Streptosporangiaceae bacterium]